MSAKPTDGEVSIRGWLDLKIITGRYSQVLVSQLLRCVEERIFNVFSIYDEIGALEGMPGNRSPRTKPAAQFKGPLLKGLWHKHHAQARFLPLNVQLHWKSADIEDRIRGIMQNDSIPDEKKAGAIADVYVREGYAQRSNAQKLTGEWIVYARHQGRNCYLTLGQHNEPDQAIRDRVLQCCPEFPELDICR